MAHLTNSALDSVLGVLSNAVKNEAKLLSSVEGDIQSIKDELDSMNGFLRYLTKTNKPHDDQVRAWMKQVRDIAYVADDCVKLYRRDLIPPVPGFWPWLRHVPTWLGTVRTRHRLAKRIHKLKERVREVGERRQRYDVTVPRHSQDKDSIDIELLLPFASKTKEEWCKLNEDGLQALADGQAATLKVKDAIIKMLHDDGLANGDDIHDIVRRCLEDVPAATLKVKDEIIEKLSDDGLANGDDIKDILRGCLEDVPAGKDAIIKMLCDDGLANGDDIKDILRGCLEDVPKATLKVKDVIIKMLPGLANGHAIEDIVRRCLNGGDVTGIRLLLRAQRANPYGITEYELNGLLRNLENERSSAADYELMVFCYSKLSTYQKSCLQYLTTFDEEKSISRTCLIRRWLAERTVDRNRIGDDEEQDEGPDHRLEKAGELCFDELVLRGFISPAPVPPTGLKIKSCIVDPSVKKFISSITKKDNFVDDLPTHLRHQTRIRKLAQQGPLQPQDRPWWWWWCRPSTSTICGCCHDDNGKPLAPMYEMVKLLKGLPEEYRLNVLDLGGCTGLTMSHLRTICEVPSLRYLSLRKTNVFWLPKEMDNLLHLETLDIRDTRMQANAMRNIFLQELKHLLAGHVTADDAQIFTVKMPNKIGKNTEILKHVKIKDGRKAQSKLGRVGSLERLRKLGVVLNGSQDNMAHLLGAIAMRSESLRSLSVWVTEPPPRPKHMAAGDGGFLTLDTSGGGGAPRLPEKLESLNLKCFRGNSTRGHIPQWIKELQFLSKVTLRHSLLTEDGLSVLGKLKSLRCLKLCRESYSAAEMTLKDKEFQDLRFLLLDHVSNNTRKLCFQRSAAPKLEKIEWNLDISTAGGIMDDKISGAGNLRGLKELKINGEPYNSKDRFPS